MEQRSDRRRKRKITIVIDVAIAILALLIPTIALAEAWSVPVQVEKGWTAIRLPAPVDAVSVDLPNGVAVDILLDGAPRRLEVDPDQDAEGRSSQLVFLPESTSELRLLSSSPTSLRLIAYRIDRAPPAITVAARGLPRISVVPRSSWGVNEDLRFKSDHGADNTLSPSHAPPSDLPDRVRHCELRQAHYPGEFTISRTDRQDVRGKEYRWALQYSKDIDLVVVHHTAESLSSRAGRSGIERVRALYEYHAVGRGWGDIGYHFVIDEDGVIYEGRSGGPKVVGAHSYCNNVGTIGIAVMGDFSIQRPTMAQLRSLRLLVANLADQYGIPGDGEVVFHGRKLPRILGHRDLDPTSCPGPFLEEILPQVRTFVMTRNLAAPVFSSVLPTSSQHEAELVVPPTTITLHPGERRILRYRLRNVGRSTWGESSWLLGVSSGSIAFPYLHPFGFVAGTLQGGRKISPGQEAEFLVTIDAGTLPGPTLLELTPVIGNTKRLARDVIRQRVELLPTTVGAAILSPSFPGSIEEGKDLLVSVVVKNTGAIPWRKGSPTELSFTLKGEGRVSILESPTEVPPGGQGTFRLHLQHLKGEKIILVPRLLDGRTLAEAEVPVTTNIIASHIPFQEEAEAQIAKSPATTPPPRRRSTRATPTLQTQRTITGDDAEMILFSEPVYTLFPRQQVTIGFRLRARGQGFVSDQPLFTVTRSSEALLLFDEDQQRIGHQFKAPFSLAPFKEQRSQIKIVAPRRPGQYTVQFDSVPFRITVHEERLRPRRSAATPTPAPQHAVAPPVTIRILLSFAASTFILRPERQALLEGGTRAAETAAGPVRFAKVGTECVATTDTGERHAPVLRLTTAEGETTTVLNDTEGGNRFRGTLECRVIAGQLRLINDIDMEDYLSGLAEESDEEPWEKQRAFAVAARSYATYYVTTGERKFSGEPYDGTDSPASFQTYHGAAWEEENPQWVKAVQSTAHQVLTYQGKVIKAPYFSSDDGWTRSAEEVWGWTHTPYLKRLYDRHCLGFPNRGHGVGMSGCGSEGMALAGKTAEQILQYYYPGTTIQSFNAR